jgi:outer membrane protein OmpA-like peptidoglycan-associated protein
MAGANEQDENHWPGYVDALTTMTMMLIFVMMILAVAMFNMSENVSRGLVEKIAQSAGLSISGDGLSTEDLATQVAGQLEGRGPGKSGTAAAASGDGGTSQKMAATQDGAALPGEEKRIESGAGFMPLKMETGVETRAAPALLTLAFKPRATALDEASQKDMKQFVEQTGKVQSDARFELRAYATPQAGALTDSRRVAYYRAMAVRASLISVGIPAARIGVQIEDRAQANDAELVQVFTRAGS